MNVQTLCLSALTLGEASGYEIKKLFEEGPFSYFYHASYGSIYPALSSLLEEKLITMREEEQDGRPDKKVYAITPKGRGVLGEKLTKEPASDKIHSEAMLMLFLADHLDASHLREVYEGYLKDYREKLDCVSRLDDGEWPPHRQFVKGLGEAFYKAAVGYMEENRDLLFGPTDLGEER